MRKKGGKKGGSIHMYVRSDIVDNDFGAQAVKFIKACWTHALTREECLDIIMLQVNPSKEHSHRCIKTGPSRKDPVACIFRKKRNLVQSVWADCVKQKRVTIKALPCNSQSKIYQQRVPRSNTIIFQIREFICKRREIREQVVAKYITILLCYLGYL